MKLKNKFSKSALSLAFVGIIGLSGCATQETASMSNTTSVSASSASASSASSSASASSSSTLSYDTHFSQDDVSWDESTVKTIDLSNPEATDGVTVKDGIITITAAGNYKLSGTLEDGQVVVAAGDEDMVRLILDNASITNSDGAAIDVQSANEVLLYSNSGTTNTISDGSSYSATGDDDPNAAIYSKADLTLAGEGTLKVTGNYNDGIVSKDGLVIASGTLDVTAKNNGIKGKDYVDILDGTMNVTATEGDGIKSTNSDEDGRGWTRLQNGTVNISAGDDGFKAEKELEIDGGKLAVSQSNEGVEGQYITLTGGEVAVTSDDDGINASVPSTDTEDSTSTDSSSNGTSSSGNTSGDTTSQQGQPPAGDMGGGQPPADGGAMGGGNMGGGGGMDTVEDATITVTGGTITVTAEGDGFDSNGTASMSGGTLTVNGPSQGGNGVFDTAGDFTVSGGTLLAGGTSDMFVAPAADGQGYIKSTELSTSEGDTVTVIDSSGATVATYKVTDKGTQLFFASAEGITAGETYTLQVNGEDAGSVTAQ